MYGVVIVEDEELERQALRSILTERMDGVRILGEAASGPEAVRLIDTLDIDLMLVDINIPRMNGLEVIRHLRERHSDTKVIITTAYDYFEMTRTAIHLKADEYLLKPIRTQTLVSTVQACLDQLGAGRQCRELMDALSGLVERNAYREAVALMRRRVDWIGTQRDRPSRDLFLDLATGLVGLVREKGVGLPEALAKQVAQLRAMPPKECDGPAALAVLLGLLDLLFDVESAETGQCAGVVEKALNYIERNLSQGVTLEEVADHAHISACYLSRLFKKTLNINFVTYLTARRIELAKDLLTQTELPVTGIALKLSYNDVNYFCKSFRKEVGLSPLEYRRQVRAP